MSTADRAHRGQLHQRLGVGQQAAQQLDLLGVGLVRERRGGDGPQQRTGVLCGGLYYSFVGQLERGAGTDVSGMSNSAVLAVKGIVYLIALVALVRFEVRVPWLVAGGATAGLVGLALSS